jgi:hypothetical protein
MNSDIADIASQQDLSPILRNLMRGGGRSAKSRDARRRLANDKLTRTYLDAGLRLLIDQLARRPQSAAEDDGDDETSPFFRWLARQGVLDEAERAASTAMPSEGTFRHRWEFQSDYIYDLLAYALYCQGWIGPTVFSHEATARIAASAKLSEEIHWITYRDTCSFKENPAYRLALLAAAATAQHSQAAAVISEMYKLRGAARKIFLRTIIESREMEIRPDVSVHEISDILQALVDGISMRMAADPDASLVDHERRQSLLGKAALAIIAACVDSGDGLTLEEFANLASGQSRS